MKLQNIGRKVIEKDLEKINCWNKECLAFLEYNPKYLFLN